MTGSFFSVRKLAFCGFAACAGLLGFAYYLQYVLDQDPCPLCMLQRLLYYALGGVFLLAGLRGPRRVAARIYAMLALLTAVVGAAFAGRHVWLQINPPDFNSCTADLFTQFHRLPFFSVIERALRATGDCARIDWTFLGLSIADWSLVWFVVLALLSVQMWRAARH